MESKGRKMVNASGYLRQGSERERKRALEREDQASRRLGMITGVAEIVLFLPLLLMPCLLH